MLQECRRILQLGDQMLLDAPDVELDDARALDALVFTAVATASNVEVRSPINAKSIGGWENYKEMLKPAMEIITQNKKYKDLQRVQFQTKTTHPT